MSVWAWKIPARRGRRDGAVRHAGYGGKIPARAGTTASTTRCRRSAREDPRAGGEDSGHPLYAYQRPGRSPRGRGRPLQGPAHAAVRGKIPARAGTTALLATTILKSGEDPRAGGDDHRPPTGAARRLGRSPRGRGRPGMPTAWGGPTGKIPARAGTTRRRWPHPRQGREDPRAGGDDVAPGSLPRFDGGRSPRGRGRHAGAGAGGRRGGKIPARAGTTPWRPRPTRSGREDPRAGGDDASTAGPGS